MSGSSIVREPWTEKYRPINLQDVRGHTRLRNYLSRIASLPMEKINHIILYGPPGTGKTSLALAFVRHCYQNVPLSASCLYLNASDDRTIEVIRDKILDFTRTRWPGIQRRFVIFDEVETMTEQAQTAMRSLLDESEVDPHEAPIFIFLCNALSRVNSLLRTRCVGFFMGHLPSKVVQETIRKIQQSEGTTNIPTEVPDTLTLSLYRGDLRQILTRLQSGQEMNPLRSIFIRLLHCSAHKSHSVFEEALKSVPMAVFLRTYLIWLHIFGFDRNEDAFRILLKDMILIRGAIAEDAIAILVESWILLRKSM